MGSTTKKYIKALMKYLSDEAIDKNKERINNDDWNLVTCDIATTPQQFNGFDCGVFITMFADFILEDIPIINFNQSDIPMFRDKICLHITKGELSYSI
jgi:Ulp1 family protease